jgi:TetR/AcrR family transcriptional regulator, tetracycline repressor protein
VARPDKPLISRERATRAALDVIDVQGLNGLSLELVARQMGVRAPSLYYHFKDKSELLSEVALFLLRDIKTPFSSSEPWDEMLIKVCVATRRSILLHPSAAPLLLEFFPRRIFLRAYDFWIAKCPYPPRYQLMVSEGLEKLTYGSSLFAAAARAKGMAPLPEFNPDEYPNLASAIRANPHDDEGLFIETIRAFLVGVAALAARTQPETRAKAERA